MVQHFSLSAINSISTRKCCLQIPKTWDCEKTSEICFPVIRSKKKGYGKPTETPRLLRCRFGHSGAWTDGNFLRLEMFGAAERWSGKDWKAFKEQAKWVNLFNGKSRKSNQIKSNSVMKKHNLSYIHVHKVDMKKVTYMLGCPPSQ